MQGPLWALPSPLAWVGGCWPGPQPLPVGWVCEWLWLSAPELAFPSATESVCRWVAQEYPSVGQGYP